MRELVAWQGGEPLLVDDVGAGNGLICLHGLGGGSYFFDGLARSLENSRRVLSFDMPGTGFNLETVEQVSMDACVQATVELIDMASPLPVTLLGHSMGAMVALKAYAERPDCVDGLIILGGLPEAIPKIKEKLSNRIDKVDKLGMTSIGEEAMAGIFSEFSLTNRRQLVGMYQRLLEVNPAESYIQTIRALISSSAADVVSTIQVPCLLMTGMEDLYAAPFDLEAFAKLIASEVTLEIFEDCGHMVFYEDPVRLNECVDNFLHSLASDWDYTYGREL